MVRRIVQKYPKLIASTIGILLSVFMILMMEGICLILIKKNSKPPFVEEWHEITPCSGDTERINRLEKALGSRFPRPGVKGINVRRFQDGTIQKIIETHDLVGRRLVPGQETPSKKDKFILFFGCSFTYGVGVNDDETMPYYVSRLLPDYKIYNYGYGGDGPHNMLAWLQMPKFADDVKEIEGICVYNFLYCHIARAIGDMYTYNGWAKTDPYYCLDRNGNLVRNGNFQEGRPIISLFYELLGKSYILKYFNFNIPRNVTKQDALLTCQIIKKARDQFEKLFKSQGFWVIMYPHQNGQFTPLIIDHLQKAGIKCYDYTDLIKNDLNKYAVHPKFDSHPNKFVHELVAEKFIRDFRNIFPVRRVDSCPAQVNLP